MNIWLPYVATNTGSSVFMRMLAAWLERKGHSARLQTFPYALQFAPDLLRAVRAPPSIDAVVTNSWAGFAFHRPDVKSICVEHLFVLDPAIRPYKSFAQRSFHEVFVRNFIARSYASAGTLVAVSHYTAAKIAEVFPQYPVTTIPNGVDTTLFSPSSQRPSLNDRPFRILFAGAPSVRKGMDLLVPILELLGKGFELRITCTQDEVPTLAEMPNVQFLGRLDRVGLIDEYRNCDILLMPTRLEGLPLVVLEAMACGLPVVSSDCTSLPEVVTNGVVGRVCAANDAPAMALAITELRNDPSALAAMSVAARDRVAAHYSLERMGRAYLKLLGSTEA